MALIPENTIEQILSSTDIVELISGYIPLKRIGRSHKALCPFHHEKTPSFIVSHERQIFHCFGCGAGGNAIGFLMQYERLEFPEAALVLAKRANILIPRVSQPDQVSSSSISLKLYEINELAADFYSKNLTSPEGSAAFNYLTKRGISLETIRKFRIGYAPDKWDGLMNYLRAKNIPLSLIEKAGLIIPREGAGYYDRFRKRIVIPVVDLKDKIVAFGARVIDDTLPKYINSPETPIYSKSKHLFGLNVAKDAIRQLEQVVIVEGYFDVIMPYQAGINNIVASCGTSLTIEQIRLLKRYTKNAVMVYDPDNAGQAATLRSLDVLIEEDLGVKVVYLPQGYDPDNFIRKSGADEFRRLIKEAQDVFDYKFCTLKAKYNFESITDKARIVSEMLPAINKFSNAVIKSACLKKLAEELKVDEGSLRIELKKIRENPSYLEQEDLSKSQAQARNLSPEQMLIKLILEEQELAGSIREVLRPGDFQDRHLAQILEKLFDLSGEGKKIELRRLVDCFPDKKISKIICELTTCEIPAVTDRDKMLNDCLRRIHQEKCRLRQQDIREQIRQAEIRKDENRVNELLKEFQLLTKKGVY